MSPHDRIAPDHAATLTISALVQALERLRDSDDLPELQSNLERVVALGPPMLDVEPLLRDVAEGLATWYGGLLAPWSRPVARHPLVLLPERLQRLPRVATVLSLLYGPSLAWVVQQSPLMPLETCVILGLLVRLGALQRDLTPDGVEPPPEMAALFRRPPAARVRYHRDRMALSLRAFQANARAQQTTFSPWGACRFVRDSGRQPGTDTTSAIAVLVDELEPLGVFDVTDARGVREELSARELRAHVIDVPPGPTKLVLHPRSGRSVPWTLPCVADQVMLVRLSRRWLGWRAETQVLPF